MNRILVRALPLLAIFILAACSQNSLRGSFVPQGAPSITQATGDGDVPFVGSNPVRQLCPTPAGSDQMQCFAMVRTDFRPTPQLFSQTESGAKTCLFFGRAYCPIDLQEAYKLPSLVKGAGRVVAIVDAFGYKHAAGDLAMYRKTMGLKPCVTATKCLRIVNQNGNPSPLPHEPSSSQAGWLGEDSLDVDMVSAICPNCKIIVVQTNDNVTSDLYAGVKTAGRLGAKYISNSWGGPESGGNSATFHQHGVVITAAAGDSGGGGSGGGAAQPCSYTYVICVGGTHLTRNAHVARGWSESVWNDFTLACGPYGSSSCGATGSGCSKFIAKPLWQNDTGCKMRSESDVSATASLRSPVAVYNSELGPCSPSCFYAFGGTSVSTPIIASVYALAGNAAIVTGAASLWKHHEDNLNDVFFGNNIDLNLGIRCASPVKYICTARAGFDGPTGWGTPNNIGAF